MSKSRISPAAACPSCGRVPTGKINLALVTRSAGSLSVGAPLLFQQSDRPPSLVAFGARLYLAWIGTSGRISIASGSVDASGALTFGEVVTAGDIAVDTPVLFVDERGLLKIAWTGSDTGLNVSRIN